MTAFQDSERKKGGLGIEGGFGVFEKAIVGKKVLKSIHFEPPNIFEAFHTIL